MSRSHKINRKVKLFTSNKLVEDRKQFKYLGSWISEDGYCETDIKTRTAMGRRPSWIIRAYRQAMYCGQTVGRIKMKLGTEVGLSPGHIVLDGDPAPPPKGAQPPPTKKNPAHVCCGQMAGRIKMPFGTEVGHSPGHIVLDGNPAPPPIVGPCPLWLNAWTDQHAT